MAAYYNENDPQAAQWLRNLIAAGQIAPGDVDERSIIDVRPDDLRGYTQCHFFAGIGVWSYALRRAGWPDDRPVWTGSCPCQPFSAAGVQAGFADERHLWPYFHYLIEERRPAEVFGEQVASKAVEPWVDLVQTDLEGLGYAFGAVPFPSAGVGAPHIPDRLFWVGHTDEPRPQGHAGHDSPARGEGPGGSVATTSVSGRMADTDSDGHCTGRTGGSRETPSVQGIHRSKKSGSGKSGGAGLAVQRLADNQGDRRREERANTGRGAAGDRTQGVTAGPVPGGATAGGEPTTGPTNGFWADADWLLCRDGKWRPVEPGTFPLVDGLARSLGAMCPELRGMAELAGLDAASLTGAKSHRNVSLKGYGNAINAEAATEFIKAYLDTQAETRSFDLTKMDELI